MKDGAEPRATAPVAPSPERSAGVRRDPVGTVGGVSSLAWSLTRDDAPNLHPGVPYTAQFITKVGRFAKVDPRKHGLLWNRWRWVGLVFWAGVVGGSFAKAWKDHGGLPSQPDGSALDRA